MIFRPLAAALIAGAPAFAAGTSIDAAPEPTETTMECPEGHLWDPEAAEEMAEGIEPETDQVETASAEGDTDDASEDTEMAEMDEVPEGCVPIEQSSLSPDALFDAVRELAYAGRLDDAGRALGAMDEGSARVSTYLGFVARRSGDFAGARAHYEDAIEADPDGILARSYLGQGYAEEGDMTSARMQLAMIRARGGAGTWPETALVRAIETGRGTSY